MIAANVVAEAADEKYRMEHGGFLLRGWKTKGAPQRAWFCATLSGAKSWTPTFDKRYM